MIIKNAFVYKNNKIKSENYELSVGNAGFISDFNNIYIFPAFCDVHVHFREPGFFYKETIKTGSLAAARGGYTDVCTMPNLNPVQDSIENIKEQIRIIEKDAGRKGRNTHRYGILGSILHSFLGRRQRLTK